VAPRPGQFRRIRFTASHDYDLVGELIDAPEEAAIPIVKTNPFPILASPRPQTAPVSR
jgi:hypothetical protein